MNLKKITLNNIRNFNGHYQFTFDKLNIVIGKNGSGKSTLSLDSLLFALYGHSNQKLEDFISRGETKGKVRVELDDMIIERQFPTKIFLANGSKELTFANSQESQRYLNERFKNIDYFRKFRMIDVTKGINILEAGKTSLLKTLFAFNQEIINKARQNLLDKKKDREIFNRDNIETTALYPSERRLEALNIRILSLTESFYSINNELRQANSYYVGVSNKKANKETSLTHFRSQKSEVLENAECPTCKKKLNKEEKIALLKGINENITEINSGIIDIIQDEDTSKDLLGHLNRVKDDLSNKKEVLSILRVKLENRIKQKKYKWTTGDILIVKKAVEELDGFSTRYITDWIRVLEPIINGIIDKIGFSVSFNVSDKGSLDLKLIKENVEFNYKDLSSGQRLILTIAFQIALLLEKGDDGLIIADEGFSSLDEDNLNHVFELFRDLPFQLICIIHRLDNIPEGIKVIKL